MKGERIKKVSLFATGGILMALILSGKFLSFAKDIMVSGYFGAGLETDAYFIALNITGVFFGSLYATINIVFLPLYNTIKANKGLDAVNSFANNALNSYLLIAFILTCCCFVFAEGIVPFFNQSPLASSVSLTVILLKVMVVSFMFTTTFSFLTAIQQSNNKYLYLHLPPIMNNIIIILAAYFFAKELGIMVVAIAGVLAWVVQVPLHMFLTRKYFTYHFLLRPLDFEMKKFGVLFIPAFFGVFADQVNMMVDTVLASGLSEGGVSSLNYAFRLISFSGGMFILAVMTIAYPMFSKCFSSSDERGLIHVIQQTMRIVVLIMTIITVIILVYHENIVRIVFERGEFDAEDVKNTSSVFFFYGLGLVFLGLREVMNKAFYAQSDTATPLYIGIATVLLNVVLSISLSKVYGVEGIAFATTVSLVVCVVSQFVLLKRRLGESLGAGLALFVVHLLLAGVVMLMFLLFWQSQGIGSMHLNLASGAVLGFIIFILVLLVAKNKEVTFVYNRVFPS